MRLLWFTDTLADVNGVSRFITTMAHLARESGRDATIVTSTRLPLPSAPNIINLPPAWAARMPGYPQLELALPPFGRVKSLFHDFKPDAVHISTPGPVGVAARLAARARAVPIAGTYHTDFPAYLDHLFGDPLLTSLTRRLMRWFHKPMHRVFTRSDDYADSLAALGIARESIIRLTPGIRTAEFQPTFRDPAIWERLEQGGFEGIGRRSIKVLYAGRVSVEKNLPMLAAAWKMISDRSKLDLVVVGDGPYRAPMERALAGTNAHFLGFRAGRELAAIYAASDFFVFPSATDTLGQVVMEAQSSGLPVLVSDRGGPREVVREGITGRVLPAHDAAAWAGAIESLAADHAARRVMGLAAHVYMREFDIARSFEHFWNVHEELAASTPRPASP